MSGSPSECLPYLTLSPAQPPVNLAALTGPSPFRPHDPQLTGQTRSKEKENSTQENREKHDTSERGVLLQGQLKRTKNIWKSDYNAIETLQTENKDIQNGFSSLSALFLGSPPSQVQVEQAA
ncbi:hypothetical protein VTJ04DRAFT_420 [Mycothermus thermophilus]|uniref:uncharacterized protein n=1 Tax=Humicola insolens TaxID=85995 RepID=UPI0037421EA3